MTAKKKAPGSDKATAGSLSINVDDLTLGQLEEVEEVLGESIVTSMENLNAKALVAIVYVLRREDDPDFTMDDARGIKVSEFDAGEDPTEPPA